MKLGYVDIPEGQVHYRSEGNGKPLVLIHQVGLSSSQYLDVIPILSKKYQVIAPDLPGYGSSDAPPREYKLEDYARSIVSFLDALKIKKANISGHLFGALLSAEVAAANPSRVDKLILGSLPYYTPEERKERLRTLYQMVLKEDGSHLMGWWQKRATMYPYFKSEQRQRMLVEYLKSGMGITTEAGHKALFSYDPDVRLPLIKSPTLLLFGDQDATYKPLEAVKKLMPKAQVKVIPGAHQGAMWEKPEEYARAILEFIG